MCFRQTPCDILSYITLPSYTLRDLSLELQVSVNNIEDFQLKDLRILTTLNQTTGTFILILEYIKLSNDIYTHKFQH